MLTPEERVQEADKAVEYAKHRLSERTAVMEWYEITRMRFGWRKEISHSTMSRLRKNVLLAAANSKRWIIGGSMRQKRVIRRPSSRRRSTRCHMDGSRQSRCAPNAGAIARDEFREKFRAELNDGQKWLVWN
jgi:hypothetical protein